VLGFEVPGIKDFPRFQPTLAFLYRKRMGRPRGHGRPVVRERRSLQERLFDVGPQILDVFDATESRSRFSPIPKRCRSGTGTLRWDITLGAHTMASTAPKLMDGLMSSSRRKNASASWPFPASSNKAFQFARPCPEWDLSRAGTYRRAGRIIAVVRCEERTPFPCAFARSPSQSRLLGACSPGTRPQHVLSWRARYRNRRGARA
jgi:hypothetical protein